MKDIKLIQLIQKFKEKRKGESIIDIEYIIHGIDISLDITIPNSTLFQWNTASEFVMHSPKGNYKFKTKELFYSPGILENLHNIEKCDYNWLLGYIIFSQYYHLFGTNIKCFHVGFGNGGIISGMQYYFSNIKNNAIKDTQIEWIGIDKKQNKFTECNSKNIIHGFSCDDVLLHNTISHIKVIINNNFNKVNLITNDILPNFKKNKILISIAVLTLSILQPNGVLLTRILSPEYWNDDFINYIILFCMIFKSTEIIRYPVCKKQNVRYRYYLLCHDKKHILHESKIYRKLLMLLKDDNTKKLILSQDITDSFEINEWKTKLMELHKVIINSSDNPQDDLIDIINKLKF